MHGLTGVRLLSHL